MENLENCPFCGSNNLEVIYKNKTFVTCNDCGARGATFGSNDEPADYRDRQLAIEGWNMRAEK